MMHIGYSVTVLKITTKQDYRMELIVGTNLWLRLVAAGNF
jgi:hypothetical protein